MAGESCNRWAATQIFNRQHHDVVAINSVEQTVRETTEQDAPLIVPYKRPAVRELPNETDRTVN